MPRSKFVRGDSRKSTSIPSRHRLHTSRIIIIRTISKSVSFPSLEFGPHFRKERRSNLASRSFDVYLREIRVPFRIVARIHVGSKGFPRLPTFPSLSHFIAISPRGGGEGRRRLEPSFQRFQPLLLVHSNRGELLIRSFDKANRRGNIVSGHDYSRTAAVLPRFSRKISPQYHPRVTFRARSSRVLASSFRGKLA